MGLAALAAWSTVGFGQAGRAAGTAPQAKPKPAVEAAPPAKMPAPKTKAAPAARKLAAGTKRAAKPSPGKPAEGSQPVPTPSGDQRSLRGGTPSSSRHRLVPGAKRAQR